MNTKQPEAMAVQPQQEPVNLETIEQYRMQMAGISTAAFGYWKEGDGIHPDYDTVALRDVAKLYAKYDEFYKQVHAPQPQPKHDPVAWMYWQSCLNDDGTQTAPWVQQYSKFKPQDSRINRDVTPLYATPHPHLKAMQQALDALREVLGEMK